MERKYTSVYCETCDATRRICAGCGKGPLLEGWLADDEYFCAPCGDLVNDCKAYDSEGVLRTGLTLPQCYDVLGGDEGSDDVYYTTWEAGEDSCHCQGREYLIAVDVIVTREYLVDADNSADALAKYHAGSADINPSNDEMGDWEEQDQTARVVSVQEGTAQI